MPARKRTTPVEVELLELEVFELMKDDEQRRHTYALLKRIIAMSLTEAEAITNLATATAATDAKLDALKTAVDLVIAAAGDNPVKVAALDAVTTQVTAQQARIQTEIDAANAALVTPVP